MICMIGDSSFTLQYIFFEFSPIIIIKLYSNMNITITDEVVITMKNTAICLPAVLCKSTESPL